ncbi:UDP-N-acetyl-D-mannosaminuronic acid transferase, WecB/TagA/CpsF family [Acetitomaculum ruminis DSM 5522]|uniref:UDP-N-acetyl-D-mannosaminuronic acid transferase, WecB/TagA/CpsF family n=1 Tax=Acetitomaculum ruminis DSM 5522 TaxID=1120918 RepID=A0A1I0XB95_9FIRM|nr:WecB/TagA/CpsF family glycosyltransferase [Acetitomaculum ruminis]SFA98295.1 UDP-N-acetyl-D-mannosaminuronic acid transferase, WecB/TagA/CpsF family [Acetitomaculum ruminis DSM 5522]
MSSYAYLCTIGAMGMKKKIDVMGIGMDFMDLKQVMLEIDSFMNDTVLNIVEIVSLETMALMGEHPEIRSCLNQANIVMPGERDILSFFGLEEEFKHQDFHIEGFFAEFVKQLEKNNRTVYVIASRQQQLDDCFEIINDNKYNINIVGSSIYDEKIHNSDVTVNDVNSLNPDVVLLLLSSPVCEMFINENRTRLLTRLVIATDNDPLLKKKDNKISHFFRSIFNKSILKLSLSRYRGKDK